MLRQRSRSFSFALVVWFVAAPVLLITQAVQYTAAASFSARGSVGTVATFDLYEASGLAGSRHNPGVLWTHNDSGGANVLALATNGAHLGTYAVPSVFSGNFEDIAIGPGRIPEVDYIYLGDIGDNFSTRSSIRVHRFPEPAVYLSQDGNPVFSYVAGAETLTFVYPDGPFDAEALMVDPVTGDLFIATKLETHTRIYQATRAQLDSGQTIQLAFVVQLGFAKPSAGDISPDGSVVALRRGNVAAGWNRRTGRTIGEAFAGIGFGIPVTGEPQELNGEALGFDGDGQGYYTLSEGLNQPIFFFRRVDSSRPSEPLSLIKAAETWSYRDLGSDEGIAWREPDFDDAEWQSGPAPLGYGQGDEATIVSYGSPSAKHRTTYFRRTFSVPPTAPLENAMLRLCFNDGVAVYINGVEALRRNLSADADFDDPATTSNSALQNIWHTFAINPALLLAGTNVISVELHRFAANGPDLTFDLQLLLGAIDLNSANYSPDPTRPTIAFSSPADQLAVTNAVLTVRGSAKDNTSVSRVLWSVGNSALETAAGTTAWSANVPLEVGTNLVRVVAYDSRTNSSLVATRTFVRLATSPLNLQISGQGTITPNLDDALLLVGRSYQLEARPATRHLFAGWSEGIVSNTARLSFVMQTNLVLQANFITNFFVGAKGPYRGLLADANNPSHERSGSVTLNLTESGKFSGSLRLGGGTVSLSGQFDYEGKAAKTVSFQRTNLLTVSLVLDSTSGAESIIGLVAGATWSAPLVAYRAAPFPKLSPAPFAGRYTSAFLVDGDPSGPAGSGVAGVLIAANGSMTLAGTLADGTKASFKAPVAPHGLTPLHLALYRNRGSLLGWLRLTNDAPLSLLGDCRWIKPPLVTERFFSSGFTNSVTVEGSVYSASAMTNFLAINPGLCLTVSGLTPDVQTNCVTPRPKNTFGGPGVSALKLDLTSGLWTGIYTNPATLAPAPLKAAFLLPVSTGYGHVLTTNVSAPVELRPGP